MNTMKSFVKQFVAVVIGDDAEARAQKALRQANSALKSQISALEGDTITFEDAVESAKEEEVEATVNYGEPITDREDYVSNLLTAKNAITVAEEDLSKHKAKIDYLKTKLESLDKDVEA